MCIRDRYRNWWAAGSRSAPCTSCAVPPSGILLGCFCPGRQRCCTAPVSYTHLLDLLNFNINNPYNAPNTDGIDPESCEYIRIIGMNIHVGDDCIAMKASKVFLGMNLKRSCEHTCLLYTSRCV